MSRSVEKYFPLGVGLLAVAFLFYFNITPKIKGLEKVLDGVITFSSITIGFLGALLAIILSISKSEVIQHLYKHVDFNNGKSLLFRYFQEAIIAGFVVVIFSIFMYVLKEKYPFPYGNLVFYLWGFTTTFLVMASYRIIKILMTALFLEMSTPDEVYKQSETLSDEQIEKLKNDSQRR